MTFTEIVNRVIELSAAIWEYWDRELPKRHPKYPIVEEGADDGPPPPEEAELREFLKSVSPKELAKILGLSSLLRKRFAGDRDQAIEFMLRYPPLAEELSEGLDELSEGEVNPDTTNTPAA